MNATINIRRWFTKERLLANSPALLIVLCFGLFVRKAAFNWPLAIMAITGIYLLIKHYKTITSSIQFRWFLVLFSCLWIPTLVALPDAEVIRSASSAGRYILYPLMAAFILFFFAKNNKLQKVVFYGACVVCIFFCVDGLVQYVFGRNLIGFPYDGQRLNGMSFPKYRLGTVLSVMSPLLFELVRIHAPRYKILWLALPLLVVIILLTATRSSWFMFAVAVFVYALYMMRLYPWNKLLRIFSVALTLIAVIGYAAYNTKQVKQRVDSALLMFKGDYENIDKATSYRLSLWATAWTMGTQNYINGVGVRAYRFEKVYSKYAGEKDFYLNRHKANIAAHKSKSPDAPSPEFRAQPHPHQIFLEIFAETGLVGLVGYLLFWILSFKFIRTVKPEYASDVIPWFLVLIAAINPVNFHMAFYGHYWSSFIMLILMIGVAASTGKLKSD